MTARPMASAGRFRPWAHLGIESLPCCDHAVEHCDLADLMRSPIRSDVDALAIGRQIEVLDMSLINVGDHGQRRLTLAFIKINPLIFVHGRTIAPSWPRRDACQRQQISN